MFFKFVSSFFQKRKILPITLAVLCINLHSVLLLCHFCLEDESLLSKLTSVPVVFSLLATPKTLHDSWVRNIWGFFSPLVLSK